MESWTSAVYWWERPDDPHSIALRAERLLRSLAAIDPVLSIWQLPPPRKRTSHTMVPFDIAYLEQVKLNEGRSRRDDDGSIIEENGFHASILTPYSPNEEGYTSIKIRAGRYGAFMSPNMCSISLDDFRYDALQTVDKQCAILRALVETWNPDDGVMTSLDLLVERTEEERRRPERTPRVGWLTYLPARRGPIPPLLPPASTVSLGEFGTIVIASPNRVTVSNPETVAAVDAVDAQLERAGLLQPEPPQTGVLSAPSR